MDEKRMRNKNDNRNIVSGAFNSFNLKYIEGSLVLKIKLSKTLCKVINKTELYQLSMLMIYLWESWVKG